MKFVLDTSFFIAALLNPGGPTAHALVKLLKGKHQVFYSEALITEIKEVANRKKNRLPVHCSRHTAFAYIREKSHTRKNPQ